MIKLQSLISDTWTSHENQESIVENRSFILCHSNLHKEIITIHYFMKLMLNFSNSIISSEILIFKLLQVATALLVGGSTLAFWIPPRLRLHPPARTQASFKALGCSYNCRRLTCGSFHMSSDDHAVPIDQVRASHGGQNED